MFTTPSGFSPHLACAEPGEEEEAPQEGPGPGACLADGPPITSASLDTLIQNLVPTADYYPEVRSRLTLPNCSCCEVFLLVVVLVVDVFFCSQKEKYIRCLCSAHFLCSSSGIKVANSVTESVKLQISQRLFLRLV